MTSPTTITREQAADLIAQLVNDNTYPKITVILLDDMVMELRRGRLTLEIIRDLYVAEVLLGRAAYASVAPIVDRIA